MHNRHADFRRAATYDDLSWTYGARLARKGVHIAVIADTLGHADE